MGDAATAVDMENVTEAPGSFVLIDVRGKDEWDAGHIEGAIHIVHTEIEKEIGDKVPDKNASIKVYCRSGRRSGLAKKALLEMGYTNVKNLGGMEEAEGKLPK